MQRASILYIPVSVMAEHFSVSDQVHEITVRRDRLTNLDSMFWFTPDGVHEIPLREVEDFLRSPYAVVHAKYDPFHLFGMVQFLLDGGFEISHGQTPASYSSVEELRDALQERQVYSPK